MRRDGAELVVERMCRDGAESIGRSLRKSIVLGPQRGELYACKGRFKCAVTAQTTKADDTCAMTAQTARQDKVCRDGADDERKDDECAAMAQKRAQAKTTRVP